MINKTVNAKVTPLDTQFHVDQIKSLMDQIADLQDLVDESVDDLEDNFIRMGQAGANGDTSHPLRGAWELARKQLIKLGRLT